MRAHVCANIPCCGIWRCSVRSSCQRPKAGRQHHRRPGARYSRFRSAEGRRVRYRGGNRGGGDFRYAHLSRRQGRGAAEARAVLDPLGRLQDLDLQAAARRQVPRRHAVQRRGGEGQFRPAEGSGQQMPLRLLHRLHPRRAGARRTDGGLQSERSGGEPPGAPDHPEFEQRRAVADGLEDQGRRLQPQSRRHRAVHSEVMDRRRPHGSRKESGLLEQGPSLSRPHRPEAAAGCAVALRQPAIRRSRYRLGR